MHPALQWGIPILVGILTFFAGRAFERRALAQANRLKLLEPVEDWVDKASRMIGIVGDDISAISAGLPVPIGYNPKDRVDTGKALSEGKEKVLGILRSKALSTRGTHKLSARLSTLVTRLDVTIERQYIPLHIQLLDKMNAHQDFTSDMFALLGTTTALNSLIQDIHSCIAELKTRFN